MLPSEDFKIWRQYLTPSDVPEGSMQRVRKAVFPVAGLGTRTLPATKAMPKKMLTVVDKPLIQCAFEEARAGIEQFYFVTSRAKSAIEDHFDIGASRSAATR
jgi:UTP--glucose-1-phosphate uridylyltransferase